MLMLRGQRVYGAVKFVGFRQSLSLPQMHIISQSGGGSNWRFCWNKRLLSGPSSYFVSLAFGCLRGSSSPRVLGDVASASVPPMPIKCPN